MKILLKILIIAITCTNSSDAQENTVTIEDFEILNNTKWVGELMYVNYADGQEVTLQTEMQIQVDNNKMTMSTQFGNEPEANSKSSIKLKKKGTYLGSEKIIKKTQLENGTIQVITMFKGRDDNKPATMYKTYKYNSNQFSITKEVQFEDGTNKFIRNRYTYTKTL
jgi:hypothetical protein